MLIRTSPFIRPPPLRRDPNTTNKNPAKPPNQNLPYCSCSSHRSIQHAGRAATGGDPAAQRNPAPDGHPAAFSRRPPPKKPPGRPRGHLRPPPGRRVAPTPAPRRRARRGAAAAKGWWPAGRCLRDRPQRCRRRRRRRSRGHSGALTAAAAAAVDWNLAAIVKRRRGSRRGGGGGGGGVHAAGGAGVGARRIQRSGMWRKKRGGAEG